MIKITPKFRDTLNHVFKDVGSSVILKRELALEIPSITIIRHCIEDGIDEYQTMLKTFRTHSDDLDTHNKIVTELDDMEQCYAELLDLITESLDIQLKQNYGKSKPLRGSTV